MSITSEKWGQDYEPDHQWESAWTSTLEKLTEALAKADIPEVIGHLGNVIDNLLQTKTNRDYLETERDKYR